MTLEEKYKLARKCIKINQLTYADVLLDLCLVDLAIATEKGVTRVGKVDVNLWKTRVWTTIEKAGLLPL
jgi:hypothetical protein